MRLEEKKTLIKFLLLYGGSLILFLGIIGVGYFNFHGAQIIKQQQNELRLVAFNAVKMLRSGANPPEGMEWSLTDQDGISVAGDYNLPKFEPCDKADDFERFVIDGGYHYLIRQLPPHTGATHISVRIPLNIEAFDHLKLNVVFIWAGAFIFFMAIATILSYIFLKPLRNTIDLLDRFIKDATHELTTPISAILMSIEAMDKNELGDRNKKRLDRITVAARTLQVVYDDLVHVLLDKKEKRAPQEIDLASLIRQRVEFLQPASKVRNLTWRVEIREYKAPVAEPREFARILDNLLSNAIKYNKTGKEIVVELEGNKLTVSDEGNGIAEDDRARIFERFARLEESQGGFGLGLSIVKELCIRNNLSISFSSTRNKGTSFYISW